ncbi:DUF6954 family protein [Pseudoneobacillus sp. C159]
MKWLIYFIYTILYLAVTFFGLGPILLADGSNEERAITGIIVALIYAALTLTLVIWRRKL